jgi:acyl phosphate:glycerol-3-phosphate acyltransferase
MQSHQATLGAIVVATLSYLLGSIPSGFLAGKLAGLDIRKEGSGDIGATNVLRVLGKSYGYSVFLADFGKGLAALLIAPALAGQFRVGHLSEIFQIVAAVFVVLGNAFPVWLRFRGGKGVATSAGMLFGLVPGAAVTVITLWIVIFYTTRYVSLASIIATAALPFAVVGVAYLTGTNRPLVLYAIIGLSTMVILRHRSNFMRLLRGTEQRFDRHED